MGVIGKDFKYKLIKNFLTKEEIELLSEFCKIRHRLFSNESLQDFHKLYTTHFYADAVMESLLVCKTKFLENEVGKKLDPTYSFWRVYTWGDELEIHQDRPSCEISVTVHVDGNNHWPIYMEKEEVVTEIGDAVVYLGCELGHYRKPLEADYQTQCFLHYVDKDGPCAQYALDNRQAIGLEKK